MTDSITLLKNLETALWKHNGEMMGETLGAALNAGVSPIDIRHALIQGLEQVRHQLMSNDTSIPDFLLCIDTMTAGLNRLSTPEEGDKANESEIPLVIGVVEGDPHDLGKNIIAAIYRNCGYRVFDLGRDVSKERFVKSAQENRARVLALSAMMSTTAVIMRDIIQEVKAESPDTVVIVGGAPLDETLARSYGADGYAETAVTILEETEAAIRRVIEGKPWLSSKQS